MGRPTIKLAEVEAPSSATAVNESEGPTVVKLTIPADLYSEYQELAEAQDLTPAELMLHRLARCKTHSSIRSLYFHESQVRQLEQLLQSKRLDTVEQCLSLLAEAIKLRLDGFKPTPITAAQAKRLHLGAYGGHSVQDHVDRIIQAAVSKATGI